MGVLNDQQCLCDLCATPHWWEASRDLQGFILSSFIATVCKFCWSSAPLPWYRRQHIGETELDPPGTQIEAPLLLQPLIPLEHSLIGLLPQAPTSASHRWEADSSPSLAPMSAELRLSLTAPRSPEWKVTGLVSEPLTTSCPTAALSGCLPRVPQAKTQLPTLWRPP